MSTESFNTNWREYVKEAQANTPGAGNVLAQVDSCYGRIKEAKEIPEEMKKDDKGYVEPEAEMPAEDMEMDGDIDPELDALVDSASMEEDMEEDVSLEDVAALAQILESMEGEDAMDIAQALSEEDDILQGLI